MSERSRYEEMDRQFNDLPLPDQEASWQKMKELLDDDDDDSIPPPIFLRSCLGWGILLLLGLVAWFIVRPERWWSENTKPQETSSSTKIQKTADKIQPGKKADHSQPLRDNKTQTADTHNQNESIPLKKSSSINPNQRKISFISSQTKNKSNSKQSLKPVSRKEDLVEKAPGKIVNDQATTNAEINKNRDTSFAQTSLSKTQALNQDTAKNQDAKQPTDSSKQQPVKQPQKKFLFAAGLGEQQQVPIAGQTAVPYGHYGRRGSLSDYVPSVFVQLKKEKKWFVMGEFRFGAAQSVKEFSYAKKTRFDSATMNVSTTTMRLKKTYYHQLPFSFNYCLTSNLSVGIGGMFSRFYGAITEKDVTTENVLTQVTTSFKQIIPVKRFTDSFLYKTQVHVLLNADYQWRRFLFGLRYTKDIQPYIKYTKPDGTVDEEKNQSLQFIVRYRLWQSKKF